MRSLLTSVVEGTTARFVTCGARPAVPDPPPSTRIVLGLQEAQQEAASVTWDARALEVDPASQDVAAARAEQAEEALLAGFGTEWNGMEWNGME